MKKVVYTSIVFLMLLFTGCRATLSNIEIPKPPELRQVNVIDGTISGQDLENLINNQIDLWEYIDRLRALLGEKKFLKLIQSKEFKKYLEKQSNFVQGVVHEYKKTNYPNLK